MLVFQLIQINFMRKYYLFIPIALLLAAGYIGYFQSEDQRSSAELNELLLSHQDLITEDYLYRHLSVIAHDSLQGRETGMRGQKIAAEYLSGFYEELGLTPVGDDGTFYQHFNLNAEQADSLVYDTYRIDESDTVLVNHSLESLDSESDYVQIFGGSQPLKGDIVFAGFGVNDPERGVMHIDGVDLQDKWVLVFEDIPHIVNGDTLIDPEFSTTQRLSEIVNRREARGIILISNDTPGEFDDLRKLNSKLVFKPRNMRLQYLDDRTARRGYPMGYIQINPAIAAEFLELDSYTELQQLKDDLVDNIQGFKAKKLPFLLDYQPYERTVEVETENIAAFFEGSDADLKDEVVVLTAHYDHVGITHPDETGDYINNGADDDGSGTVALMAIANALKNASDKGYRPKRSILFLHVSAEEKGLLGSRYYSDHPIFPIDQTVANFNADMISRSTTERKESGDTDYVFIIGGEIISSQLDSLVHVANDMSVDMKLDYLYNDLDDPNQFYRRSDHWNFGRLEIPFVFFFTGVHEDYHSPSDSVDKVDFPKLIRSSRLIYSATLQVANFDGRPEVDNQQFIELTGNSPR